MRRPARETSVKVTRRSAQFSGAAGPSGGSTASGSRGDGHREYTHVNLKVPHFVQPELQLLQAVRGTVTGNLNP